MAIAERQFGWGHQRDDIVAIDHPKRLARERAIADGPIGVGELAVAAARHAVGIDAEDTIGIDNPVGDQTIGGERRQRRAEAVSADHQAARAGWAKQRQDRVPGPS